MGRYFQHEFHTDDVGVTEKWLHAQYGPCDIREPDLSYREIAHGDERFSLRRLRVDAAFEHRSEIEQIVVLRATPGYAWSRGDDTGEFSVAPALVQPGDVIRGRVDHVSIELVTFAPDELLHLARTVYGDDELEVLFTSPHPLSTRASDQWRATLRWAMTQTPLLSNDIVRAATLRAMALATLDSFALIGDVRERRASALEQSSIYLTATSFIDEHASLPITVEDVAQASGTSLRGLRRAFAAHPRLADGPEEYLALARLSAAHLDLLAAEPGASTVRRIALRWGFADLSDFRRRYQAEYRVLPETTLVR